MTEPSAPSAEEKIRRTIARFCHFTDKGDFDNWVRLFADDGCFVLMDQEHRGHAALRAFIELDHAGYQARHSRPLHAATAPPMPSPRQTHPRARLKESAEVVLV